MFETRDVQPSASSYMPGPDTFVSKPRKRGTPLPPPTVTYPPSREGLVLCRVRQDMGLSHEEAAAKLKIPAGTFFDLERGHKVFINPLDWQRAADLLREKGPT